MAHFCSLLFAGIVNDAYAQRHKATLLSRRRDIRREEAKRDRAEYEAQILKRLAYLSEEELAFAANCLRKNEQSFLAYVFSPPVSNLKAKGLVGSPGGTHHQDYYPFYFFDFAWEALLERKEGKR